MAQTVEAIRDVPQIPPAHDSNLRTINADVVNLSVAFSQLEKKENLSSEEIAKIADLLKLKSPNVPPALAKVATDTAIEVAVMDPSNLVREAIELDTNPSFQNGFFDELNQVNADWQGPLTNGLVRNRKRLEATFGNKRLASVFLLQEFREQYAERAIYAALTLEWTGSYSRGFVFESFEDRLYFNRAHQMGMDIMSAILARTGL